MALRPSAAASSRCASGLHTILEMVDGYLPAGTGTCDVVVAESDPAGCPDPDGDDPHPEAAIPTSTANPAAQTRPRLRTRPRVMERVGIPGSPRCAVRRGRARRRTTAFGR